MDLPCLNKSMEHEQTALCFLAVTIYMCTVEQLPLFSPSVQYVYALKANSNIYIVTQQFKHDAEATTVNHEINAALTHDVLVLNDPG